MSEIISEARANYVSGQARELESGIDAAGAFRTSIINLIGSTVGGAVCSVAFRTDLATTIGVFYIANQLGSFLSAKIRMGQAEKWWQAAGQILQSQS